MSGLFLLISWCATIVCILAALAAIRKPGSNAYRLHFLVMSLAYPLLAGVCLFFQIKRVQALDSSPQAQADNPAFRLFRVMVVGWVAASLIQLAIMGPTLRSLFQIGKFGFFCGIATLAYRRFSADAHLRHVTASVLPWTGAILAIVLAAASLTLGRDRNELGFYLPGPNEGAFIVTMLGLVPAFYHLRTCGDLSRARWAAILPLTACYLGVLSTGSRSGLLISVLLAIVFLAPQFLRNRRRAIRLALIFGLLAVAFISFSDSIIDLLKSSESTARLGEANWFDFESNASNLDRVALLAGSLEKFFQRPLLGFGWGTIEETMKTIPGLWYPFPHPHNTWAHFALELGTVGLILFMFIHGVFFVSFFQAVKKRNTACAISCIQWFLALTGFAFVDDLVFGADRGVALFFALGLALTFASSPHDLRQPADERPASP